MFLERVQENQVVVPSGRGTTTGSSCVSCSEDSHVPLAGPVVGVGNEGERVRSGGRFAPTAKARVKVTRSSLRGTGEDEGYEQSNTQSG